MDGYSQDYKIYVPHLKTKKNGPAAYDRRLGDFTYHYSREALERFGLHPVSFCFFILWNEEKSDGALNREIWMKRELSIRGNGTIDLKSPKFTEKFYENQQRDRVRETIEYFRRYGLDCRYMVIKDLHGNYCIGEKSYVAVQVDVEPATGELKKTPISLGEMNELLIRHSNGKFRMGKPLNLYETDLEYYLSTRSGETGALFPGDCDMMLYDDHRRCRVVLEFKKCTSKGNIPIEEQSFFNYIKKDRSKYIRLNILRNYFSDWDKREIPLLTVFYPTTSERIIKIEEITRQMEAGETCIIPITDSPEKNQTAILEAVAGHWGIKATGEGTDEITV